MALAGAQNLDDIKPEDIVWIDGFACPPAPKIRPFHAALSAVRLIKNKEDTRQVFETLTALAGSSGLDLFRKFVATPYGRRVVTEPVKMENVLADRDRLMATPEGSLARHYVRFIEDGGLAVDGIVKAAEEAGVDFAEDTQFKEFFRMYAHVDLCHDLWHTLTGYGRDALGEVLNLGFSEKQAHNHGFNLMIAMGTIGIKAEKPMLPIFKAVAESYRMGASVDFLLQHDVEELLPQPLEEIRARLGFFEPKTYNAIPAAVRDALLEPKARKKGGSSGDAVPIHG